MINYLEKLLDGQTVEWKQLGDVCKFQNGFAFKSNLFKDNGLPIIRITNIDGKEINFSDLKFFDKSDYKVDLEPYKIKKDDILIAMSGATTGKIGYFNQSNIAYLNQRVGKFIPNPNLVLNRFLYHFLLLKTKDLYVLAGGGAQPNLSSNKLMTEIKIPIPPLSVQKEIVKILDKMTELEAMLEAELTLRRKQYDYYREQLLNF